MKNLLLIALFLLAGCAQQNLSVDLSTEADFIGDGKTDNTTTLQRAVDALSKAGGGTVQFARGNFLFAGHVNVPNNVTIAGVWSSVPSHTGLRNKGFPKPTDDGTTDEVAHHGRRGPPEDLGPLAVRAGRVRQ